MDWEQEVARIDAYTAAVDAYTDAVEKHETGAYNSAAVLDRMAAAVDAWIDADDARQSILFHVVLYDDALDTVPDRYTEDELAEVYDETAEMLTGERPDDAERKDGAETLGDLARIMELVERIRPMNQYFTASVDMLSTEPYVREQLDISPAQLRAARDPDYDLPDSGDEPVDPESFYALSFLAGLKE